MKRSADIAKLMKITESKIRSKDAVIRRELREQDQRWAEIEEIGRQIAAFDTSFEPRREHAFITFSKNSHNCFSMEQFRTVLDQLRSERETLVAQKSHYTSLLQDVQERIEDAREELAQLNIQLIKREHLSDTLRAQKPRTRDT